MKYSIFVLLFLWVTAYRLYAQVDACKLILKTDQVIRSKHVDPIDFNPTLFHQVLDGYLEAIDPEFIVFCKQDSLYLHEQLKQSISICDVFTQTEKYIKNRLNSHDSLVNALDLSYFTNNDLPERFVIPCFKIVDRKINDKALQVYAKQYYKYLFLDKQYVLKEAEITLESKRILEVIIKKRTAYYNNFLSNESALLKLYLNAISMRYDPHSLFLDANEHQQWNTALAKEELSFGFDFEVTDNDLYKVTQIIPGSAAWNSKQMDVGDRIDQIELLNGKKYLVGIDTDEEIYEAFIAKQNSILTFYVTKLDGTKVMIKLTKSKIEVLDNVINGYIIKKDKQRFGYIDLPSFYSEETQYGGNGCASDMAREILQLKKDTIDGLILDLRGNGGGYMHEALTIAGLFIDEGVLALQQIKGDKPRYLKDPNRGVLYDGKLIVLAGNFSASASELLAGVLQQYNRAIIVGNTTFGKATMQVTVPLDSLEETQGTNNYYLNITIGKFYMINKQTNQAVGIRPDIALPSIYDYMDVEREAKTPYYIKPDSVQKLVNVVLYPKIDLNAIKKKSEARLIAGNWVARFKSVADTINRYTCSTSSLVLNQKNIFKLEEAKNIFFVNRSKTSVVDFIPYAIVNTSIYNQLLKDHERYYKPNQYKIDELKKDVRLFETINILSDYTIQL